MAIIEWRCSGPARNGDGTCRQLLGRFDEPPYGAVMCPRCKHLNERHRPLPALDKGGAPARTGGSPWTSPYAVSPK